MNNQCCRCGRDMPQGSLKYILSIRLYADFDGEVQTCDKEAADDIEYLINCLEGSDKDEVESDVNQEMAFLLCKGCRDHFSRNPLNRAKDDSGNIEGYQGILH